jgi:hypothetical protein
MWLQLEMCVLLSLVTPQNFDWYVNKIFLFYYKGIQLYRDRIIYQPCHPRGIIINQNDHGSNLSAHWRLEFSGWSLIEITIEGWYILLPRARPQYYYWHSESGYANTLEMASTGALPGLPEQLLRDRKKTLTNLILRSLLRCE